MKTGTSHVGTTLTKLNKLKKLLDIAMTERRFSLVKRTCSVTVILSVVLFVCIVRVFTGRKDETKYNDLITTGGAIRRSTHLVVPNFNYTVCKTKQCRNVEKYIKKSMDLKANPCTDFFNFTCGGWINKNPIPKTSSSYSTFAKLNSKVEKALRKIIENNTRMDNEYMKKAKMFYKSCSNLIAIEKRDAKPLVDLILDIGSSKLFHPQSWHEKNWNLTQILLGIHKKYASSGGPLFSVHVSNDPRNNTKHILEVSICRESTVMKYIYIYIYVCVCVCMYVCMCVCMYVCMYIIKNKLESLEVMINYILIGKFVKCSQSLKSELHSGIRPTTYRRHIKAPRISSSTDACQMTYSKRTSKRMKSVSSNSKLVLCKLYLLKLFYISHCSNLA